MNQRERIVAYLNETYGTEAEYLWEKSPQSAIFRHPRSGKWYAAILAVARSKLGLSGEGDVWVLDVKCDPMLLGSLLLEKGFLPAYHMNKNSWISALLDETLEDERLWPLLEGSYEAVGKRK